MIDFDSEDNVLMSANHQDPTSEDFHKIPKPNSQAIHLPLYALRSLTELQNYLRGLP